MTFGRGVGLPIGGARLVAAGSRHHEVGDTVEVAEEDEFVVPAGGQREIMGRGFDDVGHPAVVDSKPRVVARP